MSSVAPSVSKTQKTVQIAPDVFVGGDNPCFVLAEAGINHNGEVENAKRLIDLAKLCGVCSTYRTQSM